MKEAFSNQRSAIGTSYQMWIDGNATLLRDSIKTRLRQKKEAGMKDFRSLNVWQKRMH